MQKALTLTRRTLLAGCLASSVSYAQPNNKGKVVKILVGFPPGQATDIVARLMADKLQAVTGDTYIVDNRPGQGGSIAMGQLAKSANDGSTMMLTHMSAVATNPHLYKSVPYDSVKDFEPVGLVGDLPFILVSNPTLPFSDVKGLVEYAKAHPGKLTNASSGNGTVSHLAMEEFKRRTGIDVVHVPYRGSAPGLTDVVAGNVSIALETAAGVQPFVQGGKLRALGAATPHRLAAPLNIATIEEQGFGSFRASTWLMLLYPVGTSPSQVKTMHAAIAKAMHQTEVEQRMVTAGVLPRYSVSAVDAKTYVASEYQSWGEVVRRSGVRLD